MYANIKLHVVISGRLVDCVKIKVLHIALLKICSYIDFDCHAIFLAFLPVVKLLAIICLCGVMRKSRC